PAHQYELLLKEGADMILHNVPHHALPELIKTLRTPFNPFLDQIPGIAFRNYFGNCVVNATSTSPPYPIPSFLFLQQQFKTQAASFSHWFSSETSVEIIQNLAVSWQKEFHQAATLVVSDSDLHRIASLPSELVEKYQW